MRQLIGDLSEKFELCVTEYTTPTRAYSQDERTVFAEAAKLSISYAARITKAFADANAMKQCHCEDLFIALLVVRWRLIFKIASLTLLYI